MERDEIAEFLGWYFGDGCISIKKRKQFFLTGDLGEELKFYEEVVVPTFNRLFQKHLNYEVKLRKYPSVGVCGIYIFNEEFVSNLLKWFQLKGGKKLEVTLPTFSTSGEKISFLRGLFDTDGSIYFCKSNVKTKKPTFSNTFHYKPKIKIATISENIIDYVYNLLLELGFSPRLYSPRRQRSNENIMYSLVLDTQENVDKWIESVGFRNHKHNSKVNVWKKFGFCPPNTSVKERELIISEKIDPLSYYSF